MKKKSLFLAMAVSFFYFSAGAQEASIVEKKQVGDNWFVSVGAGPNLLLGEQDDEYGNLSDRLRLGGELSVGKWFNPNFGMRTQLTFGKLNGFNYLDNQGGEYTRGDRDRDLYPAGYYDGSLRPAGEKGFYQNFYHSNVSIDLLANLTHLFNGYYNRDAFFELVPFVGVGYMHAIKSNTNPTYDNLFTKIGFRANFNLDRQWSLYLEPQANLTSSEFDGYVGNRDLDGVVKCFAGVQFNINKGFSQVSSLTQEEVTQLNDKLNRQHELIANQQTILERQQQMLKGMEGNQTVTQTQPSVTQPQTAPSKGTVYLPEYIRFGLNSFNIDISEKHKIDDAIAFLKANPESKLLLIGYADKQTGNSSYNYKLSCKRADTVADRLKGMGIAGSRLIIQCVGDKEQPYDQNDWNRVVIMVERK